MILLIQTSQEEINISLIHQIKNQIFFSIHTIETTNLEKVEIFNWLMILVAYSPKHHSNLTFNNSTYGGKSQVKFYSFFLIGEVKPTVNYFSTISCHLHI